MLRSDEVRKDLAGLAHDHSAAAGFGEGLYRPETTADVYRTLLERAEHALELGEPIVLDASWSDRRFRDAAAAVARTTSSELVELRCDAPAEVAADRIERRHKQGGDPSDATIEVATAMAASADPWPNAMRIDTAGEIGAALAQALAAVGPDQGRRNHAA